MALRFGIHTPMQDAPVEALLDLWRWADASGFYWASVWDHFYEVPPKDGRGNAYEAVSMLTALALSTRRVRVGCLVFCTLYRNPAYLAKAITCIDHLSHGRAELGLGAGWHDLEARAYGFPFPSIGVREDMLEEAVQIIKAMLREGVATFLGRHFTVREAYNHPLPLQRNLRIWIGGRGERRTLRAAARYADGWNAPYISPEAFAHKSRVLDRWCEKEGRDPSTIARAVNLGFYMGADGAGAQRKRREAEEFWASSPEHLEGLLLGTPQEAVERIAHYQREGASLVNIVPRYPYDWEALYAFVEEVMPAFR